MNGSATNQVFKYLHGFTSVLLLLLLSGCKPVANISNPCLDEYPSRAKEALTGNAGQVARIMPVEWLEDGVMQIIVESGDIIIIRPGDLPVPPVGAQLEVRIYSDSSEAPPFAGCYCQKGTDICLEEYSYP